MVASVTPRRKATYPPPGLRSLYCCDARSNTHSRSKYIRYRLAVCSRNPCRCIAALQGGAVVAEFMPTGCAIMSHRRCTPVVLASRRPCVTRHQWLALVAGTGEGLVAWNVLKGNTFRAPLTVQRGDEQMQPMQNSPTALEKGQAFQKYGGGCVAGESMYLQA